MEKTDFIISAQNLNPEDTQNIKNQYINAISRQKEEAEGFMNRSLSPDQLRGWSWLLKICGKALPRISRASTDDILRCHTYIRNLYDDDVDPREYDMIVTMRALFGLPRDVRECFINEFVKKFGDEYVITPYTVFMTLELLCEKRDDITCANCLSALFAEIFAWNNHRKKTLIDACGGDKAEIIRVENSIYHERVHQAFEFYFQGW